MKEHTTNYQNTFIEIAEDCPVKAGEMPPLKGEKKSVANRQFDMVYDNPYKYTSDDVLFQVYAERNDIKKSELDEARKAFFSKGQPCFRASPLTKRYGWGVHSDEESRIAIYGVETPEYKKLAKDSSLKVVKAMRTSK
ncbi:MAG: hypothetical protein K0R82_13 [Flavipsychrobacter sp.]|jgi:hypothetical protein|nr:hypothetical protein [Flavipsychrobacter sp.]